MLNIFHAVRQNLEARVKETTIIERDLASLVCAAQDIVTQLKRSNELQKQRDSQAMVSVVCSYWCAERGQWDYMAQTHEMRPGLETEFNIPILESDIGDMTVHLEAPHSSILIIAGYLGNTVIHGGGGAKRLSVKIGDHVGHNLRFRVKWF